MLDKRSGLGQDRRKRNIQKEQLIALTRGLIKIDSSNPPGNEKEIAFFIKAYLKKLGVSAKLYEFRKDRPNVVCKIASLNSQKSLLITPHIDTVPPTGKWRFPPFSGALHKGRIYGRGATDDKVNVAVALHLIKLLQEEKIRLKNLDLVFAFTADEETGSEFGIKPLLKHLKRLDYGLVLDSNEFDIIVAQKGLLHLHIEIFGKEAHGAYPQKGINAIEKSVYILNDILKYKFSKKGHPLLKKPTLNIGKIEGGDKVNIVAGCNFFELDIRYLPFMSKDEIIAKIKKIIEKYHNRYKIKILAHQKPLEISRNHFLVGLLKTVLKHHKIKHHYKASMGATVINFLKEKGIESFAFGFGSRGCAHITNEYVKVRNLSKGMQVLKDYVLELDRFLSKKYTTV
ncbi:MAG: ArgE/DapE family deacylase [Candidatus Omnitrophica bacterium]|nr:ArgE/DapE family deacylase [Candidatus Omnitrophota bacterium]